jgi:hypothetical protein
MRAASLAAVLAFCAAPLAAQASGAAATPARQRTLEFSGLVLVNGFYNSARMGNSDVPTFADSDALGVSGGGGSIRQTRLGAFLTDPDVLGGTFTGEVDVDFFGGQQASTGGRAFPLLRLRRAVGTVQWRHTQLLFGQEVPLVAERNPRSLAGVGTPDFSTAGNLWFWIPQVRFTTEVGSSFRVALQAAALAPTAGTAQGTFNTQLDSAERSGRPYLQGRLRLGWGPADDPSEIAVGGHVGWLRVFDSTTGDSLLKSSAVTVDWRLKFGIAEVIGEAYSGQALAGLGGGGVGQNFGVNGAPVRDKGGWGQLNLRPVSAWMFGGGCGLDDPDDADVPATGRFKNLVCEGHLEWRPSGPLIFGFEYRRLKTTYQSGEYGATHLNLAAGFRF